MTVIARKQDNESVKQVKSSAKELPRIMARWNFYVKGQRRGWSWVVAAGGFEVSLYCRMRAAGSHFEMA